MSTSSTQEFLNGPFGLKIFAEIFGEITENFSNKDFTVTDLMNHFNGMSMNSDSDDELMKGDPKKAKKAKKAKKIKDPNAPKKPTNSYMFYSQHMRAEAAEEGTGVKFSAKQLGIMWKEVSEAEPETKAKFDDMAKQDNERYKKEKAEYDESQ